jgi:hypothetical protein
VLGWETRLLKAVNERIVRKAKKRLLSLPFITVILQDGIE